METTIFTWVWVHFDPWFLCFMSIYTWDIWGLCYLTSMGYILVAETTNRFCCNTSGVHRESSNVQIFDDYGSFLKAISRMGILLIKPVRLIFRPEVAFFGGMPCESHCYRCIDAGDLHGLAWLDIDVASETYHNLMVTNGEEGEVSRN